MTVLRKLDGLLDDEALYPQERADFGKRYRYTLLPRRRSTPMEVLLRLLILKHLYHWSHKACEGRSTGAGLSMAHSAAGA